MIMDSLVDEYRVADGATAGSFCRRDGETDLLGVTSPTPQQDGQERRV